MSVQPNHLKDSFGRVARKLRISVTDRCNFRCLLRSGASNQALEAFIRESFEKKAPGVETLLKQSVMVRHIRPMHTLGG